MDKENRRTKGQKVAGSNVGRQRRNSSVPFYVTLTAGIYVFFTHRYWGRLIGISLLISFLIFIQMLIWKDSMLFFKIMGIEILIALLVGWIVFMIKNRSDQNS